MAYSYPKGTDNFLYCEFSPVPFRDKTHCRFIERESLCADFNGYDNFLSFSLATS
jgi:hypothetical protein